MNFIDDVNAKIDSLKVNSFDVEVLSSGNFIELRKGKYYLNNGESIVRETVHKKVGTGNAVAVFAVDEEGKILLVIQPRVSIPNDDKINVELPAGYIENGEDAIVAGIRELEEETGYTSSEVIIADSYYPSLGASGEMITLILALNCKKSKELKLDSDEYLHSIKVSMDEFRYLLDNDYIKDVNARIGYYKYLDYIKR